MKLYKVYDVNGGKCQWTSSQASAATLRKEFNSKHKIPRDRILTMEVEVPTSKIGLIEFLNNEAQ